MIMQELGDCPNNYESCKISVQFKKSPLYSGVNIRPKFINFETFFDFFKVWIF